MRALGSALLVLLSAAPAYADPAEIRFALVAGRNDGASGSARLHFAEADARRFASTLSELGGFEPAHVVLLEGPSRAEFVRALQGLDSQIAQYKAAGYGRALLVLYWSGHADDQGLQIGPDHLSFDEVRSFLDRSSAAVRLAFIDACRSGALTATAKGAHAVAAEFEVSVASEPSPDGTAVIASTAPGEDALESADVRGSFFTGNLTAGMRGPADADHDGRVTLSEAYRYAYARTVSQTAQLAAVPQHPTYDMELRGKGDIVLADLSRADGLLAFAPSAPHRWLVVREGGGNVWELHSDPERDQVLGLASGNYRLVRADADDVVSGTFTVGPGSRIGADSVPLTTAPYAVVTRKGLYDREPTAVVVSGAVGTGILKNFGAAESLYIGTRHDLSHRIVLFPRFVYGQKSVNDSGLRYDFQSYGLEAVAGWRLPLPGFEAYVGPVLGGAVVRQTLANGEAANVLDAELGAAAGMQFPMGTNFFGHVGLELVGHRFILDNEPAYRATTAASFGLEYSVRP